MMEKSMYLGLDFGTTNSALSMALPDGSVRLASFELESREAAPSQNTFRSILYCDPRRRDSDGRPHIVAGPEAIESYLRADVRGRLIQSLKSFLTSRLFTATNIYGSSYTLEDLIAILVKAIRDEAEAEFGPIGSRVVAGRPVRFSGAENQEDDSFAVERLLGALRAAGFEEVVFEYEPVAAALAYARRIDKEQLVLIADFGGGTSDFSLVRLGPASGGKPETASEILGTSGVAIGGDTFDSRIIRNLVSPTLGRGTEYRGLNRRTLAIPAWIYGSIERWHHLSFLNNRETLHLLGSLRSQALEKEKIQALIDVIENNMGYDLYRSVETSKHELSDLETTRFRFEEPPVHIEERLTRDSFEAWIEEDVRATERCVEDLLQACGVRPDRVERVFLTGGSAFVPLVRWRFQRKFGLDRLQGGGELTSVAEGLSLRARSVFR